MPGGLQVLRQELQRQAVGEGGGLLGVVRPAPAIEAVPHARVVQEDGIALIGQDEKISFWNEWTGSGLDTDVNFNGAKGKMEIRNNVFFNEGTRRSPRWGPYTYVGNLFEGYDTFPDDPKKIVGNPGFVDATAATARALAPLAEVKAWHQALAGYRLRADSPCLNRGVDFAAGEDCGGRDLWGNRLFTGHPDIGAWEMP